MAIFLNGLEITKHQLVWPYRFDLVSECWLCAILAPLCFTAILPPPYFLAFYWHDVLSDVFLSVTFKY